MLYAVSFVSASSITLYLLLKEYICGLMAPKMILEVQRRARLKAAPPSIPMEIRAEKALDAIYVCCFGRDPIEDEDERLLIIMLSSVFPSVKQPEMQRMIKDKRKRVEEGVEEEFVSQEKPLPKEAVELQMKDLQFLQQNKDT